MSLAAGTRLGHYEILAPIGAGGMGEVYRARDTRLKRDVALKVLPEAFAGDPGRMARFQREAEVLASLNHPNIAHIYGVEERALVMELVEGHTLPCPLPIETALAYGKQIAEALEYAHERGVIHRDLKPANIKVTADGVVKILDFGLAKAVEEPSPEGGDPSISPTLTLGHTQIGVVMGTAAYMAPEQAAGARVDRRADIWSFGAVLYEMLTGKRAFGGDSIADTLATVMKIDPDWSSLPRDTPTSIHQLVRRCLTRDRKQRLQAIGEARIILENPAAGEPAPVTAPSRSRLSWALAAVLLVVAVALAFVAWKNSSGEPPRAATLFFPPPEKGTFSSNFPALSVSPDGRRVAFEAVVDGKRGLWVRDLDNPVPRMLAEIGGVQELPFWAPDSRRLGFFSDGKLRKIDVAGGPVVTLADAGGNAPGSGSWNREDVIVFGTLQSPLYRVSASGGPLAPVSALDSARGEVGHWAPWFLPDGHHFLYVAGSPDPENRGVYVGDLGSKIRKRVFAFGANTIYVNPGYLMYVRDRTLLVQAFDPKRLETNGDPMPLAEQVNSFVVQPLTWGQFSSSQNGLLGYTSGGGNGNVQLTWFDQRGTKLDTVGTPGLIGAFSLSPDDTKVAIARSEPQTGHSDIWIRDLPRGSESRLTAAGSNMSPVWSADGTRIFYESIRDGIAKVYHKAANNTGQEDVAEAAAQAPSDASRDGRYLLTMTRSDPKTGLDIWVLPLFGDRKAFPFIATEFQEIRPRLSPDGRWLAYQSNESQRMAEAYVVSFPQPGAKWQISTNGGAFPTWSRDGRELYYYSLNDNKVMAVAVKAGSRFEFGVPRALFEVRMSTSDTSFAVTKDGRFLLPALVEQEDTRTMTVVLNWPEMVKKR